MSSPIDDRGIENGAKATSRILATVCRKCLIPKDFVHKRLHFAYSQEAASLFEIQLSMNYTPHRVLVLLSPPVRSIFTILHYRNLSKIRKKKKNPWFPRGSSLDSLFCLRLWHTRKEREPLFCRAIFCRSGERLLLFRNVMPHAHRRFLQFTLLFREMARSTKSLYSVGSHSSNRKMKNFSTLEKSPMRPDLIRAPIHR